MALYTKYRPDDFNVMVGNTSLVRSVQKILEKKDRPHAWMFTGRSGIGKTTIARIIAKKLGAAQSAIFETNAADVRGIDGVREIIERVNYRIPGSPVSVFILDECHQLTKEAQNALLKVLEDPPAHAYFILCTTDSHKVIDTIRTRCAEFQFNPLSADELLEVIMVVAEQEGIKIDDKIYEEIAKNAAGSPRLALTMLERCAACADVKEALGLISGMGLNFQVEGEFETSGRIFDIMLKSRQSKIAWPQIARLIDEEIYQQHKDVLEVKRGLTSRMGRYLIRTAHSGIADAVLLMEMNKDFFTNASFTALMYKVTVLVLDSARGGSSDTANGIQ